MTTLVILRPSQGERLSDIGSRDHEEGGEVEDSRKMRWDGNDDNVSDHGDDCTENAPCEPVTRASRTSCFSYFFVSFSRCAHV